MALEGGEGSLAGLENLISKVLADRESQKDQAKKIDSMEKDLKLVKGMICDENGNCRLPTRGDLLKIAEAQGTKGDLSEFSGQELWDQIKKVPRYVKDVEEVHLKKLKEDEEYLKKALSDRGLVQKMVGILCDPSGENCKLIFNEEIDRAHKEGKGKGEHWLTKK